MKKYPYNEYPQLGGVRREYKLPNGYALSLINSPIVHFFQFAWEGAVIDPEGNVTYNTPLTHDVEVFLTDEAAAAWIEKGFVWGFEGFGELK